MNKVLEPGVELYLYILFRAETVFIGQHLIEPSIHTGLLYLLMYIPMNRLTVHM